MLLYWFVNEFATQIALDGTVLDEDKVECLPKKIPNAILDEDVDIYLIQKYFTADAWLVIEDVLKQKKVILHGCVRFVTKTYLWISLSDVSCV